jgi:hypothetical protein
MNKKNKTINYNFFHWGPFLYKTCLEEEEIKAIKKLCSKKSKHYNHRLAGLIKHEHVINPKKMFPIIYPYLDSYARAYIEYSGKTLGSRIELETSWVNYMTKFESNPLHGHDGALSFVIFIEIPKGLKKENKINKSDSNPGGLNFINELSSNKYNITFQKFLPEKGDFFIFPASLQHFVNHFQSEGERISVSGNLKIT